MSYESNVFGCIKTEDKEPVLEAISMLPEESNQDQWPFLTRSMFCYTSSPKYRIEIFHFAASYKDILSSWEEWEKKFEDFLSGFDYLEVKLILEDSFKGDFLVAWLRTIEQGNTKHRKIRRYLDYQNSPDIDFL